MFVYTEKEGASHGLPPDGHPCGGASDVGGAGGERGVSGGGAELMGAGGNEDLSYPV